MKVRIVVLASGRGSNFEAMLRAIDSGTLDAEVAGVITDVEGALVVEKAQRRGFPTEVIPVEFQQGLDKTEIRRRHEEEILVRIKKFEVHSQVKFLVLAGYRRIIGPTLLQAFQSPRGYSRIVNVHPSLLPAFPGLKSYAQAFSYGVKVTGVTVHLVEGGVDTGPICAQESFSIADCYSEEEVERRGLEIEHRLFPQTLQWILKEKFEITTREQKWKSGQKMPDLTERRLCVCPY